jgi:rubrerythrin
VDRNVDREKVRRIFQEVTSDETITPGEFEEMISNLSGDELLMLRTPSAIC